MRLLLAADSIITLDILLNEITARSWPVGTEARVLSVVEDDDIPPETWREKGYGVAAVHHEMRTRGEEMTVMAIDRLRAIGIPAEITVMRGAPEYLISFAARKWESDLILIRAHNRFSFRNLMLGSVAKSVVDSAPCSVEIVRSTRTMDSGCGTRPMRILLATDGSGASLAASQALVETTWPAGTEVKVVSVINPIIYSFEEIGLLRDRGTRRAHRSIGETLNVLSDGPFEISGEVIAGRSARQIIDRARKWQADLIVVGTHQRQGLKRLLFGSTSAAVANGAHCSARVIRGQGVSRNQELSRRANRSSLSMGKVYRFEESARRKKAA